MPKNKSSEKHFAVKIYTTALEYDYSLPWNAPTIERWTGSGFVIDGKRIVTNAHVAGGAIFLEVQLANDSIRYPAKLKAVSHECDLAEIEVDSEEFWEKTTALKIGETPHQKQKVEVHGFPIGGEGYCITDGIVSRLENDVYVHGGQMLLSTQVSAPINPGNSGGAVISDGEVVGVVHQGINSSQSIGYMIPASVLKHFLVQVETNNNGFPSLAIETQTMENPYLRERYKMHEHHSGVLVRDVPDISCAKGKLQEEDVLLAINGIAIWNDGTVHIDPMKRVDYRYLINNAKIGDEMVFKILRDGNKIIEKVQLTNSLGRSSIIQPRAYGIAPSYYIIAGAIVVQPVSKNFMYDNKKTYANKPKVHPSDQLVAINTILKSRYTQGYDNFGGELIVKVNNKSINNLQELIMATEENKEKLHIVETQSGKIVVIPNLSKTVSDEILEAYHIKESSSQDLAPLVKSSDNYLAAVLPFTPLLLSKSKAAPTTVAEGYKPVFAPCLSKALKKERQDELVVAEQERHQQQRKTLTHGIVS